MEAHPSSFESGKSASVEILKSHGYTHFYGLDDGRSESPGLPRFVRKLRKRIHKRFGSDTQRYTLKKLDHVMPPPSHMLVCSKSNAPLTGSPAC